MTKTHEAADELNPVLATNRRQDKAGAGELNPALSRRWTPPPLTHSEEEGKYPVCGKCGSDEVDMVGTASWNSVTESWEWSSEFGYGTCAGCGDTQVPIRYTSGIHRSQYIAYAREEGSYDDVVIEDCATIIHYADQDGVGIRAEVFVRHNDVRAWLKGRDGFTTEE